MGAAAILLLLPLTAAAQPAELQPATQLSEHRAADVVEFLTGSAIGLGMHESGHLLFDGIFAAQPDLHAVHLGPFPFFAIGHRSDLSPRREFTVSSAGFWVQEATNEWLLTRQWGGRPLKDAHAPLAKGIFAFNVLNSVGYAAVAFAKAGPPERDTRGMADSIRVDERAIAALVLVPAILDAIRFFNPDQRWPRWTSRATKTSAVLLVLKRTSSSRR